VTEDQRAGDELVGVVRFGSTLARRRRRNEEPRVRRIVVRYSDQEMQQVLANAAAVRLAPAAFVGEVSSAPLHPVRRAGPGAEERAALLVELMGAHRQLRGAATNFNQAMAAFNATGEAPEWLPQAAEYVRRVAARVDAAVAAVAGR
jgi:hypothetical protein